MAEELSRKLLFSSRTERPPTGFVTALHCDIPSPLSAIIVAIIRLGSTTHYESLLNITTQYHTLQFSILNVTTHYFSPLNITPH